MSVGTCKEEVKESGELYDNRKNSDHPGLSDSKYQFHAKVTTTTNRFNLQLSFSIFYRLPALAIDGLSIRDISNKQKYFILISDQTA